MKKISIVAVLGVMISASGFAASGDGMNNNTSNNGVTVVSVEEVRNMADNAPVVVRGYMVRQNGENSYIFQDSTGTINLEIDDADWGGLTVTPNDYVEVWGAVDRNGMSVMEIDVSAIKKI